MKTLPKLLCIIKYSLEAQQFKYVVFNIWEKIALKNSITLPTKKRHQDKYDEYKYAWC